METKQHWKEQTMLLHIFGLVTKPSWWHLNRVPARGGPELAVALATQLPNAHHLEFFIDQTALASLDAAALRQLWSSGVGELVAKPRGALVRDQPDSRLWLVTTAGPDSGRLFPLTRRNLSVGRSGSRAQVRDPWLSAHDFNIRLSADGTLVRPVGQRGFLWESGTPFRAGTTQFVLQRGTGQPVVSPRTPGPFEIAPGQPPSPPNVVLQVIGAAAPLLIGVVLMMVTGMWYFLLFSGISVMMAAVMMTQYRRARNRFVTKIRRALVSTAERFQGCVFEPHQLTRALSARGVDPLSLAGSQPNDPVLYVGSGQRKATIEQFHQDQRWDDYLTKQISIVLTLHDAHRIIVVGDPGSLRPIKNWCLAQLLRHAKATDTGIILERQHVGGSPTSIVGNAIDPTTELPQLIFTTHTTITPDETTTVINLPTGTVEGTIRATNLEPLGISTATLQRVRHEIALDQPQKTLTHQQLTLAPTTMCGNASQELATRLGAGTLGIKIDLVHDGPHLLITGTTGSGKSELVLTVLIGMVERYPPTEVSMILLDFKGGSSFNVLAPLPHTMSVETNHIAADSFRSLDAIAAELHRRELLFAKYEVPDYQAFRRSFPGIVLPRLVVAIDELRVFIDGNPDAAQTLAHLAATGRSLGFHLVVATQRTQGAVSADIRANIGSIISLRTATEHDSWEVLGSSDAFRISPTTPGRAYFKSGADRPRLFQTSRYMLDDEPVIILPTDADVADQLKATTDWTALIRKLGQRAATLAIPDPAILPGLPHEVTASTLVMTYALNTCHAAIGLVDDPANCAQYALVLGQATSRQNMLALPGSVAWVGTSDSGIEATAALVADYVQQQPTNTVFLDGGRLAHDRAGWDRYFHAADANPDSLKEFLTWLDSLLTTQQHTTVVITDWGSWSTQMVSGNFQGFEDLLIQLLRQYAAVLTVYIFGARELAGGRMLAMIPDRLYLPTNSSPEHRMIWPKLISVPAVAGRAVLVTAEKATGGLAVQLAHARA